ncbi:DUF2306 domain-containing protein [Sandarakinorhabdus sp.]|uniref:DUF2306 domain-containing protein n=1 Tax=Sandarakinorhabdus sp. TaxID=1916663 RepID=UPI00286D9B94|nr:DUF2306 domain-containing protein [Sandarakinorhabdus sp.]
MLANLSPLLLAHLTAVLIAMPLGFHQLTRPQGTPAHALLGRIYIAAMLIANIGALASFRPETRFIPFHILAIVSLVTMATGMWALRRWLMLRNPAHLRTHKIQMAFSWIGLMMAGASQVLTNNRFGIVEGFTPTTFWVSVVGLNLAMYALGSWWVFRRLLRDDRA